MLGRFRHSRPLPEADPSYQPFVSLHIAAYNEPPDMLIETIKRAEAIDYPHFEIVVIDNNTKDPAVWRPVEEYCRDRPRVTFVHVDPWPGFKAGALNLALRQYTDERAEIIGLIDADDFVVPHYLKETAPYFSNERIGFLQSFEGNRDYEGSPYYSACVDSYQAFYLTNMSSRNERDSIPFVGTMGLFRRSALEQAGGWNEWCICEDTEASVRVLKLGWSGLYVPRCFGRGVVPPSYAGLCTQRYRWCFGGMQILRLHWRSLMPWDRSPDNRLSSQQRRDYLMASLGWMRDLVMVLFTIALFATTALLLSGVGLLGLADRRWDQSVGDKPDRHRPPQHAVGVSAMDEHVPPPHPDESGYQPGVQLDHRSGLCPGFGAARGRLPPYAQERPEREGGPAVAQCALVGALGDGLARPGCSSARACWRPRRPSTSCSWS